MADTEELAEVISRLTPEDATTVEALEAASAYAATVLRDELPTIKLGIQVHPSSALKYELARQAGIRARQLRNDWLKEHGAYARG